MRKNVTWKQISVATVPTISLLVELGVLRAHIWVQVKKSVPVSLLTVELGIPGIHFGLDFVSSEDKQDRFNPLYLELFINLYSLFTSKFLHAFGRVLEYVLILFGCCRNCWQQSIALLGKLFLKVGFGAMAMSSIMKLVLKCVLVKIIPVSGCSAQ
ncbi:hypothetical protein RJ641_000039 [Dillenia turbinata]|uniref:Uncharacterized protein n=1 Tax=Dillenia turbinata TaxID=194707 RepID=A0AAN8WD61_9MAGN